MLALVVFACLAADPTQCKDHRVPVDMVADPNRCALFAPPFVAKWADEHPGWEIRRFECKPMAEKEG